MAPAERTKEQRQAAERQARRRAKLTAAMKERDQLRAELDSAQATIANLEQDLEQAQSARIPRCRTHGIPYSCGLCHREDAW